MDKQVFLKELIFLNEQFGSRQDLFENISTILKTQGYVKQSYYDAISRREREFPTGIKGPVIDFAIPHTDPEHLNNPFVAMIRPTEPIAFEPMGMADDTVLAKLIFVLGVQKDGMQIELLQKLMAFFSDNTVVTQIMEEGSTDIIEAMLNNYFNVVEI